MSKEPDPSVFDVEKLESQDVESSRSLCPTRNSRQKQAHPNQLDLFSYQPQEPNHADAPTISSNGKNADEPEVRRDDGENHSQVLAGEQSETRGRPVVQAEAQESVSTESRRSSRPANQSGENGEPTPGSGSDGSVADSDEADDAGRREGREPRRDGYLSQALSEEDPAAPSRDYRITAESRIGEGSIREKAERNLDAIQLLKLLEREGRQATQQEKNVLARFTGWGAMPAVFDTYTGRYDEWNEVRDNVRGLLSDEEFRAARATVPNAHYTSPFVIEAIWSGLERLGLKSGARILEPSLGIGNFFGLMPERLMPKSLRAAVEIDSITARLAKQLYQDATIFESGFEEAPFPDNFFDIAVGNVPFGNYGVHDPKYKSWQTASIHDYFFIKTLDKLREGGVLALITSRFTMDKKNDDIREYLASKADLLGAIRLPNTSFMQNAGTKVTTDILFLQKRAEGQEALGPSWQQSESTSSEYGEEPIFLNEYYIQNPKMMLGTMKNVHSRYGMQPELIGAITREALQTAIDQLPQNVYTPRIETPTQTPVPQLAPDESIFSGIKNGAFVVVDNLLGIRQDGVFTPASDINSKAQARIRGMMNIRDHVRNVFKTQLADEDNKAIIAARRELNAAYDHFIRTFGCLSNRDNRKAFRNDPDAPLLLSLEENFDEATGKAKKAAIFDRPTLERYRPVLSVETAAEALAVSLNEYGHIEWGRMSALTGQSTASLQRELDSLIYENPETGEWETADKYLSGNVREKLATAHSAANLDKKYLRNVAPLEGIQPTDLVPAEITARLGATWIPTDDIADFIAETIETNKSSVRVDYLADLSTWAVTAKEYVKSNIANTTTYGTSRFTAINLIEDALNGKVPTAYDTLQTPDGEKRVVNERQTLEAREAQQKLKDKWSEWVWKDEDRTKRLAKIYNEKFNSLRLRVYDGSHLTFPGMNKTILRNGDMAQHQKNAVWRILQGDSTLLAHCVGAGKTWIMTASAMEGKRIGLFKKSMVVVPNHLVEQWGAAFLQLYPQANIFVAGKEHFQAGNRQKAMSRIATGNYDAVIVSHKCFEHLPVSDDLFDDYMDAELDSLEEAIREANADKGNRRIVKLLEAAKKRLTKKIEDRAGREKKDNTITFEELGIDRIFVDEADVFKNLGFITKMSRVAGLPNSTSNRATDMHIKTRYLRDRNNGKGVVFATGTPISNTMAELYTMQRYLAPEVLERAGMAQFDAWAANFGEAVTALELSPSGSGYRMHTRFAKFVNLPELLTMFRDFADVQTSGMLNLPRPALQDNKNKIITAPTTPELKAFVETLMERSEKIKNGTVKPTEDNMLKITSDGRKAALDMRLVNPFSDTHPQSKVSLAMKEIFSIWKETEAQRSTQLAFCDLSTPARDRFNVYDAIRSGLIGQGIPPHEIAFIHDADTDAAKQALFEKINNGKIRVLLGSTEKMGAGTNVQKKLIASHNIDAPWRPRDIEQRDGRILRQGNENSEVRIYRYVTEGSFDAYMWQTLETKAKFIQQVMNGDTSVRTAEDINGGALTYAEIKAIASGNPAVMEKVKVDTEVRKLDSLRTSHQRRVFEMRRRIAPTEATIKSGNIQLGKVKNDVKTRDANRTEEFSMSVQGRTFKGKDARDPAAKALNETFRTGRASPALTPCGKIAGFDILCRGELDASVSVFLHGEATYTVTYNPDLPIGTLMSLERTLRGLENFQTHVASDIAQNEKALAEYKLQSEKPFEHEARLKSLLAEQSRLNASLDLDKDDKQATITESDDANIIDMEKLTTDKTPIRAVSPISPGIGKPPTAFAH